MGEQQSSVTNSMFLVDSWIFFLSRQEVTAQLTQFRQKWCSLWIRRLTITSKQARVQEEQDDALISSLATLLQEEELSHGLYQPQGIGQRPKQISVDMVTGQSSQYFEKRRQSDSMSTNSEEESIQPTPTRYFIVKPTANSLTALEAAMSHNQGVWSFPSNTERKLASAVSSRQLVIAIFSVASSGAIQGCGVFTGQSVVEGGRTGIRMEWLSNQSVSLNNPQLSNITNKLDEGRRLQTARDGQELDQLAAASLLQIMGVNNVFGLNQGRQRQSRYFK